ncbi:hypothetical protein [Burkholderia sp. SRS-W-2-2016]|uniref:hypothetical protein n=1 Tax=Burkholderia sp. SRS-W-2-2016 TaxID=1926878 RepID=UPI000AF9DF14|nr:hypothetical protein [Burkholderia sp. SRS-W-2-2016]
MRKILFSIFLLPLLMVKVCVAASYQLPGITTCDTQSGCAIAIDEDGFLRNSVSHEKIFDLPLQQTVFDSYSLLKSGKYYIVERSNTSSSRSWDLLLLTYVNGSARVERVVSLSRGFAMTSPKVYWSGYECRGDVQPEKHASPFDAAKAALCGAVRQPDSLTVEKDSVISAAKAQGLVVHIPVYSLASNQSTTYFFPGVDEPDAGALLCLRNCKSGKETFGRYGGWIGQRLWIDVELQQSGGPLNLTGNYIYIGKNEKIKLAGSFADGKLNLRESVPGGHGVKQESAIFEGYGSSDAFAGKWRSIDSGKIYKFFIASRVY